MGHATAAIAEQQVYSLKTPNGRMNKTKTERKPPLAGPLSAQQATDTFQQHMPRRIRLRVARSVERKKAHLSQELPAQTKPNSPVARNAFTGKLAVGPWLGPFAPASTVAVDEPASPMYLNSDGTAFFSLEEDVVAAPPGSYASSGISAPGISQQAAKVMPTDFSNVMRRLQHMQVAAVEYRTPKLATHVPVGRVAGSKAMRNMHGLKQPRRGF